MLAQKVRVTLDSLAMLDVRVVTRRGVMEGRRAEGKGEGPWDWSLVVNVDHIEIISLRTLIFGLE